MALEIERRYLVEGFNWKIGLLGKTLIQSYLPTEDLFTCRIRIATDSTTLATESWLTLKLPDQGFTRLEFEYPIPINDAEILIKKAGKQNISKIRHELNFEGHEWIIDEFLDDNLGLIMAEIELNSETESFARPPWIGLEVTHDHRYNNSQLAKNPFGKWNLDSAE